MKKAPQLVRTHLFVWLTRPRMNHHHSVFLVLSGFLLVLPSLCSCNPVAWDASCSSASVRWSCSSTWFLRRAPESAAAPLALHLFPEGKEHTSTLHFQCKLFWIDPLWWSLLGYSNEPSSGCYVCSCIFLPSSPHPAPPTLKDGGWGSRSRSRRDPWTPDGSAPPRPLRDLLTLRDGVYRRTEDMRHTHCCVFSGILRPPACSAGLLLWGNGRTWRSKDRYSCTHSWPAGVFDLINTFMHKFTHERECRKGLTADGVISPDTAFPVDCHVW